MVVNILRQAHWTQKVKFVICLGNIWFHIRNGMELPNHHITSLVQVITHFQYTVFVMHVLRYLCESKQLDPDETPEKAPGWVSPEELGGRLLNQFIGNAHLVLISRLWVRGLECIWDNRDNFAADDWGTILSIWGLSAIVGMGISSVVSVWVIAFRISVEDWAAVLTPGERQTSSAPSLIEIFTRQQSLIDQLTLALQDFMARITALEERLARVEQERDRKEK